MSADRPSPRAQRLARHRAEMELALREGLSLDEARFRLRQERRNRTLRCGTAADSAADRESEQSPRPRSWMDRYENY